MGLWGRKEACLSIGTHVKNWKELLGIYVSFIFPVFKKGMMPVKEHRGVIAMTGVCISKGWGLGICRVIFDLRSGVQGAPKQRHLDFQSLVVTGQRMNQLCS